jgi:phosphatidate phosphatase APP1
VRPFAKLARALREFVALLARPVRTARGRRGVVLQPYRGYGSRKRVFLIGRVFRQSDAPGAQGIWDLKGNLRDVARRIRRRAVAGARVRGHFYGAEAVVETDRDGYFRLDFAPGGPVPEDRLWHPLRLTLEGPEPVESAGEVFIAPPRARFAVISDIDDTVMHTGVANKAVMLWRLFVQGAESRTAFPGVSALYRALHAGASGDDANPMLYVSRAPWGIYDILDAFFQRHVIPVGPIMFLREWGLSWKRPLPRRAREHKRELIDAIMDLYDEMPFVLIGDSGQHDPEVYRHVVERHGDRVLAVYIRDVSTGGDRGDEIEAMAQAVARAGSHLVLAPDSAAMAEHAAGLGLIVPEAVAVVVGASEAGGSDPRGTGAREHAAASGQRQG